MFVYDDYVKFYLISQTVAQKTGEDVCS